MKKRNLQAGIAPLLIIAIIAILGVGGGAYVVTKNKEAKVKTGVQGNAELNENANAKTKGSLRSLLSLGKDTMCTFTSTAGGVSSSGTVYILSSGEMRGDFTTETSAGAQTSSMIVKGGTSYVWSGSQGMKMKVDAKDAAAANAGVKSDVGLDSQGNYQCENWPKDESKFSVPSSVKFMDLEALMKTSGAVGPGNINLKNATELGY